MGACPLSCSACSSHSPPRCHHLPGPSLTTSSAKRTLSSSVFGIGLENSMYCSGLLSRRLISGSSLPPKQHRKPRPWRLLLRGAMVTAGQGDSQQAGALGPHRDLRRGAREHRVVRHGSQVGGDSGPSATITPLFNCQEPSTQQPSISLAFHLEAFPPHHTLPVFPDTHFQMPTLCL